MAAKNLEPKKAVNIEITPNRMEFVDADTFEEEIRMDERRKWIEKDIRRHQREKERREYRQALFLYKLIMRCVGVLAIILIVKLTARFPETEGGLFILLVPAVAMVICPDPDK